MITLENVDDIISNINLTYTEDNRIYIRRDGLLVNIPPEDIPDCIIITLEEARDIIINGFFSHAYVIEKITILNNSR